MTDVHPSDRQLAAWLDATEDARPSMSVSDHLMGCHRCRSLIGSAFDSIALPEPPYSTERLSLGTISESTPEDLERGQVWRVRWEDTSQLAMVWSAEIDWVGMIPVTPDPNYADESCVILASEGADGHSVLWLGLETPLPYHVLDYQVSVLPTDGLKTVRKMLRQGKSIDTIDLKIGQPIMSAFDDRYLYRSELGETFNLLAESEWAPAEAGGNLETLAVSAGTDITSIAGVLDLAGPDRLRLRRGLRPLTIREAERLTTTLKVDVTAIIRCNPALDEELVLALSRPRWRGRIDDRRHATGASDIDGRRDIAYAVTGLAARATAPAPPSGEEAWHERIGLYFAA